MKEIDLRFRITETAGLAGEWTTTEDIAVSHVQKKEIYIAPDEPSFVAWPILWKEASGKVKLSFTEATGDLSLWPPTYNFNSDGIDYYLKTLVSADGGETWTDTGFREDLDRGHTGNSDHHIRHVVELPDGSLLRNYPHTKEGRSSFHAELTYDKTKEEAGNAFAFSREGLVEHLTKSSTIWKSSDGGASWEQIYEFADTPPIFISGLHLLNDGVLVGIGTMWPSEDEADSHRQYGILVQSSDGGRSWSEPVVIAQDDDVLNPQALTEECDFVQLDDTTLLALWRVAPATGRPLITLKRDESGHWSAGKMRINKALPYSGYPYMHRASDGTIFYYCHTSMKYSCDDGESWKELPLGFSYYGQITEATPGRMVAITQKNMGDCSFPWKHDASMLQTTFDFARIGVLHQHDAAATGVLASVREECGEDFHIALELTVDGAAGVAYDVSRDRYRFVALTMVVNSERMAGADMAGSDPKPGPPQNIFLQVGTVENGATSIVRKISVGKILPRGWAELQVSRSGGLLKAACKLSGNEGWGATYTSVKDEQPKPGKVSLFTDRSQASFRRVRFSDRVALMRENWLASGSGGSRRIAIDAGQAE